jgi:hypothetical protein
MFTPMHACKLSPYMGNNQDMVCITRPKAHAKYMWFVHSFNLQLLSVVSRVIQQTHVRQVGRVHLQNVWQPHTPSLPGKK